jgi:hypothetical protein
VRHAGRRATANNGAWSLPQGADYYNAQIRARTTTNLTAQHHPRDRDVRVGEEGLPPASALK